MKFPNVRQQSKLIFSTFHELSGSALFVLLNGLIISLVVYFLLYFASLDLRDREARAMTRDIYAAIETAIGVTERRLLGAASTYAEGDEAKIDLLRRQVIHENKFAGLLWVTDKGTWQYDDLTRNLRYTRYSPASGLPSYQDLYRAGYGKPEKSVIFVTQMPWQSTRADNMALPASRIALMVRVKLPEGGEGVLFALAVPAKVFGVDHLSQFPEVRRVGVYDVQASQQVLDVSTPMGNGGIEALETHFPLMLWNRYGEVRFQLAPTFATRMIAIIPWAAVIVIVILTLGAAFALERKHVQDRKIEEMSKTLEGAHSELRSSQSEKERLFQILRRSEREHKAMLNSISDVIFETDSSGKIVFLNETWARLSSKAAKDVIGQPLFALMDPADRARQRDMFDELVGGKRQAYRSETQMDMGGHVLKPVEIAFSMLRVAEDKSLRVVGTITDIEKRRRAEIAVREAEQRYRAMFENATSGIYQSSLDGRYINVNPALAEILGYASPQDLMDSVKDISLDVYLSPHDNHDFMQKLLFEGRVSGIVNQVKRKDGRVIWIMENARVVRNDRGGIHYFEGSVIDITENKMAEEAMRQARIQAEMSSRSRMEFLANMSHELRTPLNAIIGFSEIIKDEVMGAHEIPVYKEYAQDIYNSGNHLLKIISEILEVSKIESGNRELNISAFSIKKALSSCMTILGGRVEEARLTLEQDIPDDLPKVLAEELAFKQIMLNLLTNAVKFTPEGGKIMVSAVANSEGEIVIDVKDSGIGMSEEEIDRALRPFSKIDNNFGSMKEGTGLGLTIVESLVRLHGGELKIMSEKGKGTTARVILPPKCVYTPENKAGKPAEAGGAA